MDGIQCVPFPLTVTGVRFPTEEEVAVPVEDDRATRSSVGVGTAYTQLTAANAAMALKVFIVIKRVIKQISIVFFVVW